MEKNWWAKFILLAVCVIFSGLYIYPTLTNLDTEKSNFPFKDKITLGLDLQGGVYMVMGVDFDKVYLDMIRRQKTDLESKLKEQKISVDKITVLTNKDRADIEVDDPRISIALPPPSHDKIIKEVKDNYTNLRLTGDQASGIELGLKAQFRREIRENTIDQSIEVIRNRIDEFGVAEPTIASQGTDRLVVELPGVKDISRAKGLIGKTARLEWKLVDDKSPQAARLVEIVSTAEKENNFKYDSKTKFSEYVEKVNDAVKGKIPDGTEIAFERRAVGDGTTANVPYLLKSKVEVSGEDLLDARIGQDENNFPVVAFTLNPKGASLFEQVTRDHIKERLAIVLDQTIFSAPTIQSVIPGGRGQISMGRGNYQEMLKEAKDLAIVLRAGALPAELEFLEQRVVGPSLGQDSIQKGASAGVMGAIAVLIFIAIYYRLSGLIASISLVFNVSFVLAVLVLLEATLTLPGIAGIALTVGIAVDSNVVIYERIREELRAGKKIAGAVEAGFQKAIRTILDANVTNAAAAIVLLNFGTGPIKGFAVTMLIGIVTTLFTAVFVCKLFFDLYVRRQERRPVPSLSI